MPSEDGKPETALPRSPAADSALNQTQPPAVAAPAPDLEERKLVAENAFRDRMLKLQERELDQKAADAKKSRWSNPLILAVLAAFIAGIASISVQYLTGRNQLDADEKKHNQEMETEAFRAEAGRILEAIKGGDPDRAACNLRFFLDIGLINTTNLQTKIDAYLLARKGGSGAALGVAPPTGSGEAALPPGCQSTVAPVPVPSKPVVPPQGNSGGVATISYETGWMDGGHNQNEACDAGIRQYQPQYPGKILTRVSSSEEMRWTGFRHAEYKYYCTIRVDSPPAAGH